MNKTITIQFNFFGPYIKKEEIPKILDPKLANTIFEHQKRLLAWFFDLPFSALSVEILERYVGATPEESYMSIIPHTKEILEKLLTPLRSAKKCYCLGDYVATIALCGAIGEMMTILLWKINNVKLKGKPIDEQDEIGLFGSSFENLNQDKRLRILKTFGHVNKTQYTNFTDIRKSRKPYLHLWSTNVKNEQIDALDSLTKSYQLFKEITGVGLASAGTVKINPLLMKLFEKQELDKTKEGKIITS